MRKSVIRGLGMSRIRLVFVVRDTVFNFRHIGFLVVSRVCVLV